MSAGHSALTAETVPAHPKMPMFGGTKVDSQWETSKKSIIWLPIEIRIGIRINAEANSKGEVVLLFIEKICKGGVRLTSLQLSGIKYVECKGLNGRKKRKVFRQEALFPLLSEFIACW